MHTPVRRRSPRRFSKLGLGLRVALGWAAAGITAPGAVLADPPPEPPPPARGEEATDVTRYRFDDDLVRGAGSSPQAEVLTARRRNDRDSLVRVRTHYIPELLKSAEDL